MADLLQDIEEWVENGVTISVQLQLLVVDGSCDVGISSSTVSECTVDDDRDSASTIAIVGASIGVVFFPVIVAAIVIIVVMLVRRNRRASLNPNNLK